MDGREDMGMSFPASYFIHRGMGAPAVGLQPGLHSPLGMSRSVPNPNPSFALQSSAIGGSGGLGGGGSVGSAFQAASTPSISPHGVNITAAGGGGGGGVGGVGGVGQAEQVKRKRGRPRKYGSDGTVSLALSPMLSPPSVSGSAGLSGSGTSTGKRGRGRPRGTGRKQQLASLGEWVSGSAGMSFTPHIITIPAGEDIASKIMSFSQQGSRVICILSANGSVSRVTLRQPATSGGTVTYEGQFEILCLSGSYLPTDEGGSQSRSGGLSISLSNPDGRVIGGGVGGLLKASSPVQVIVGSFVYGGSKSKVKKKANQEGAEVDHAEEDKHGTPSSSLPGQSQASSMLGGWAAAARQQSDFRNAHVDIDLMRG